MSAPKTYCWAGLPEGSSIVVSCYLDPIPALHEWAATHEVRVGAVVDHSGLSQKQVDVVLMLASYVCNEGRFLLQAPWTSPLWDIAIVRPEGVRVIEGQEFIKLTVTDNSPRKEITT